MASNRAFDPSLSSFWCWWDGDVSSERLVRAIDLEGALDIYEDRHADLGSFESFADGELCSGVDLGVLSAEVQVKYPPADDDLLAWQASVPRPTSYPDSPFSERERLLAILRQMCADHIERRHPALDTLDTMVEAFLALDAIDTGGAA